MKVWRMATITVNPDDTPGKLLSKFDIASDEARAALALDKRDPFGKPYRLDIFLASTGKFKWFEDVERRIMSCGLHRPLTIRELMSLNLYDPTIRKRQPLFGGGFVLEYEVDLEEGTTMTHTFRWMIRSSSAHRHIIIDSNSLFAFAHKEFLALMPPQIKKARH
jgi:hypothetical protein